MSSFTINVPFEKLRITDEELAKRQELIKKHTKNGKVDLFLVFNEFYEWLSKKRKENIMTPTAKELIEQFIVNQLGINLCSVKDITIDRQDDNQIKKITIDFKPA